MEKLPYESLLGSDFELDCPRSQLIPTLREKLERAEQRNVDVQLYPIGFVRVPFTSHRLAEGYHLNIWRDEFPVREPFYPTHTHMNDVVSRVVYGCVLNKIWKIVNNPHGNFKLVETHYDDKGSHQTNVPGRVSHSLEKEEGIPQDKVYRVPIGQFHESVTEGPVVTLMKKCNFDMKAKMLNLVPLEKEEGEYHFDHRQFSKERLWNIVQEVKDQLQAEISGNLSS